MTDSDSLTRRAVSAFKEATIAIFPAVVFYILLLWVYGNDGFEGAVILGLAMIFMEVYDD